MWCSLKDLFALWEMRNAVTLSKVQHKYMHLVGGWEKKKEKESPTSDNGDRSVL